MTGSDYSTIHKLYCLLSGLDLEYVEMMHSSEWYLYCKRFDADDLRLVIGHIKRRYKDSHDIMLSMLRFTFLIRQLDTFAELLAESKAMNRPKATERQKVLSATGREETPEDKPPQQVGMVANRVLRGDAFLKAMKELRESVQ